jgi:hypothetical protein
MKSIFIRRNKHNKEVNKLKEEIKILTNKVNRNIVDVDLNRCSRVEVISQTGREYTNYFCKSVEVQLQDNLRTMKIFLENKS